MQQARVAAALLPCPFDLLGERPEALADSGEP
jgi:hypothetical protein